MRESIRLGSLTDTGRTKQQHGTCSTGVRGRAIGLRREVNREIGRFGQSRQEVRNVASQFAQSHKVPFWLYEFDPPANMPNVKIGCGERKRARPNRTSRRDGLWM